jgi:CO dehydrogenase nickel-insertion accessory protein CooC1
LTDIKEYLGIPKEEKYDQYFLRDEIKSFTISDPDAVTQKYSIVLKPKLRLMTAGPQTEVVLHGQSCSHILTTPLKLYLPLLSLEGSEMVVVDEKAGADGVTTGIVTGIDVGVIVIEPALHSIKTALQIADLMKFYNTPFVFAGNKITNQFDKDFIVSRIGQTPVIYLPKSDWVAKEPGLLELTWQGHLNELYYQTALLNTQNRYERTREKFRRNLAFTK